MKTKIFFIISIIMLIVGIVSFISNMEIHQKQYQSQTVNQNQIQSSVQIVNTQNREFTNYTWKIKSFSSEKHLMKWFNTLNFYVQKEAKMVQFPAYIKVIYLDLNAKIKTNSNITTNTQYQTNFTKPVFITSMPELINKASVVK